jgi:hypothetical protein
MRVALPFNKGPVSPKLSGKRRPPKVACARIVSSSRSAFPPIEEN